jgi:2-polyprenyl-3-methyl-5-hydroxy-6-metoxy-1,4-benzoquinol methylase
MSNAPKKFIYKEVDVEGHKTLDVISLANHFNKWMYNSIKLFCHGRILEVGSGIGNISQFFLQDKYAIMLSDIRENYCDLLSKKFSHHSNLLGIKKLDLVSPVFDNEYSELLESFDTVYALNVVEHIETDKEAIANAKKLLKKGGTLIILVPAYQFLYNTFDKELYHFRRYTAKTLGNLFLENGLTVQKKFYFNALGIVGWYVSGTLLKNKIIPESQMSFYNYLIPLAKLIDAVLFRSVGLSVIIVGKK